jgi:hypothetical protein
MNEMKENKEIKENKEMKEKIEKIKLKIKNQTENNINQNINYNEEIITSKEILFKLNELMIEFQNHDLLIEHFNDFNQSQISIPMIRVGYYNQWIDSRPDILKVWEKVQLGKLSFYFL